MICQRCGTYMNDGAITCENCGTLLSDSSAQSTEIGVRALRQGRLGAIPPTIPDESRASVPEYGDYDMSPLPLEQPRDARRKVAPPGLNSFASRPTARRGVPVNPRGRSRSLPAHHVKPYKVTLRPTNWMIFGLIIAGILLLAGLGYLYYLNNTDEGQRITARKIAVTLDEPTFALITSTDPLLLQAQQEKIHSLRGVPPQSYWLVGQEYMDAGDVQTAILAFRLADFFEPQNYDGLLLLASAYELNAEDDFAEKIYLDLIETVAPSRAEAYSAIIRMYLDQSRNPEAAETMLLAYKNTDRENFFLQRKDFIPLTPLVDLPAGRYELSRAVHLTSPQGYDIYYTLDDTLKLPELGVIPEGWIPLEDSEGAVAIPEGSWTIRSFCVSENLISDPLSVTYTIFYPSPAAPYANLAPNTYSRPQNVLLRPGSPEDVKEHKTNPLTFYYTIDGSTPTTESPVFDGTPIKLPSGRVILRAVCVNHFGKMSSIREVEYKFDFRPNPLKIYGQDDKFQGFTLNSTSPEDFRARFGSPNEEVSAKYLYMTEECRVLEYDWGSAVFILTQNKWVLVRIDMNHEITEMPRRVHFGDSEEQVVAQYKDMGQVQAPNRNRGLYYADPDIGRVIQNPDGTRTVQYSCINVNSHIWVLQFHIKDDRVYRVSHYYQP